MTHASKSFSKVLRSLSLVGFVASVLFVGPANAHIRISPAGRMGTSDQVKFIQRNLTNPMSVPDSPGPCATFTTPMATRLQLKAGQQFTFTVEETINHPGRFIVQFRQDATQNFWTPGQANQLAVVEDNKAGGTTPITFTVPNTTCDTCMFRVLQQMDEQPGEFYVHCVDVTISSNNPVATPTTGTEGKSSTAASEIQKPGFGGCGTISDSQGPRGSGGGAAIAVLALLLMPLAVALGRRRQV